jgi:hypothetical protein
VSTTGLSGYCPWRPKSHPGRGSCAPTCPPWGYFEISANTVRHASVSRLFGPDSGVAGAALSCAPRDQFRGDPLSPEPDRHRLDHPYCADRRGFRFTSAHCDREKFPVYGAIASPPRVRFDGGMPRAPYVREKYTREVSHARKKAKDYFAQPQKTCSKPKSRADATCCATISSSP